MRWILAAMLSWSAVAGAERPVNAALITQMKGAVNYVMPIDGSEPMKAKPFQRARSGDTYQVPDGGVLRLVYTKSGRQELWTGPAKITIGREQSERLEGAEPKVKQLPTSSTKGMKRVPSLLKRAGRTRLGTGRVRGGGPNEGTKWRQVADLDERETRELAMARKTYAELYKATDRDDPTADFFLIGVLGKLRLKAELQAAVTDAQKRFPKDETLVKLSEWLAGKPKPAPTAEGESKKAKASKPAEATPPAP